MVRAWKSAREMTKPRIARPPKIRRYFFHWLIESESPSARRLRRGVGSAPVELGAVEPIIEPGAFRHQDSTAVPVDPALHGATAFAEAIPSLRGDGPEP